MTGGVVGDSDELTQSTDIVDADLNIKPGPDLPKGIGQHNLQWVIPQDNYLFDQGKPSIAWSNGTILIP